MIMFSLIPEIDSNVDSDSEDTLNTGLDSDYQAKDANTHAQQTVDHGMSSSGAIVNADVAPPKGTSPALWEKFKSLQKRRQEAANEKIPDYKKQRRKRRRKQNHQGVQSHPTTQGQRQCTEENTDDEDEDDETVKQKKVHWQNIKQFIGINDHLKGTDPGRLAPKSGLEKEVDKAVGEGDFESAEKLSDRLATRNLGERITEAIDSRDFLARKKEEDEAEKAKKKKKKPPWTFEAKHRWEMKSNM
ncbi:protein FAM204A-like [Glandiceps talaboti]